MRVTWLAIPVLLLGPAALAEDAPMPLKKGAGDEVTGAYCNACHTSDYIAMNSPFLTPDQWKAEVAKMRSAFAAPIDNDVAATISDYLAANYAAPKP